MLLQRKIQARAIAGSPHAGFADDDVLRLAIHERRILVTYNTRHFKPLLSAILAQGISPPGIVFIARESIESSDYAALTNALAKLAIAIESHEIDPSCGIFLRRYD